VPDARHGHHRRVNNTRNGAALTGRRENVFPPRRLSRAANHRPPSIHGAPERAASCRPVTYVISVIELPLFSCHGCSDASLLPALGSTFYPPKRVHHSTGPTIAEGEVCRTGHNLRRPRQRLVPVGQRFRFACSRDIATFRRFQPRIGAIACQSRPARTKPGLRLNAEPHPTPRGAARRPPRPRRRPGPAPW
jgi:hypothetical protein